MLRHGPPPPTNRDGCAAGCLLVALACVAFWLTGSFVFWGLDEILRGLIRLHQ